MTVVGSCKLQRRNILDFVTQAVRSHYGYEYVAVRQYNRHNLIVDARTNISHRREAAGKAAGTAGTLLNVTVPGRDIVMLRLSPKQ